MLKYKITNGNETMSIKEAAALIGMSESTVRNYVVNHGCKTIKGIRAKKYSPRKRSGTPFRKIKTTRGEMTLPEVVEAHDYKEVSLVTLRGRISRRGSMCPSLWYPKLVSFDFRAKLVEDGLEAETGHFSKIEGQLPSLQRKTCTVNGRQCCHYSECTDSICFDKKMPDRYREDKSCYRE